MDNGHKPNWKSIAAIAGIGLLAGAVTLTATRPKGRRVYRRLVRKSSVLLHRAQHNHHHTEKAL